MSWTHFSPLRFESDTLPVAEQFETFASAMINFDMHRRGSGPFRTDARVWKVGALVISELRADPVRYERTAERIARDRVDHIYVILHLSGRVRVDCGRGTVDAGAGTLLAVDMRQPCPLDAGRTDEISVAFPRKLLLPRLDHYDPHGLVAQAELVPLWQATLTAICQTLPLLEESHAPVIETMLVNLATDTLSRALRTDGAGKARQDGLVRRVRNFMSEHLAEPLDGDTIARRLGISRSTLYRAFTGAGGVLRQLQDIRLRRVCDQLTDPAETRSIAVLAAEAGFADKSHFARAFKTRYGQTPGQYRGAPFDPATQADPGPAGQFASLIKRLD